MENQRDKRMAELMDFGTFAKPQGKRKSDDNRLIALFMGWENSPYPNTPNKLYRDNSGLHITSFKYHCSWEWIMPVVQKINYLDYTLRIKGDEVSIDIIDCVYGEDKGDLMNNLYKVIVEFIKWYNKHKIK